MYKTTKYIASTIIAIIFLLLLVPSLIPSAKYKNILITQTKKSTGFDLNIEGKISIYLLPKIRLEADNVKLNMPNLSHPTVFNARSLELSIEIMPLLIGKLVISNVVLENLKVTVEELVDNQKNQQININNQNNDIATLGHESKTSTPKISIKNIHIFNGIEFEYVKSDKFGVHSSNYNFTGIGSNIDIDFDDTKGPIDFNVKDGWLKLKGRIGQITNIIPIHAEIQSIQQQKFILTGQFNLSKFEFLGKITTDNALQSENNYLLDAKIIGNKEEISVSDIAFQTGIIKATANAKYDIRKLAITANLNLQPGNLNVNITPNISVISKETTNNIKFKLSAENTKQLVESLNFSTANPWFEILSNPLSLNFDSSYNNKDLTFENLNLYMLGANVLKGNINIKHIDTSIDVNYDLNVYAGDVLRLLTPFPMLTENFNTAGVIGIENNTINVNSVISAAQAVTKAIGSVDLNAQTPIMSLELSTRGKNLNQTLRQLLGTSMTDSLGEFDINTKFNNDSKNQLLFNVNKSKLKIGSSEFSIDANGIAKLDRRPKILADIIVSQTNLTDYNYKKNLNNLEDKKTIDKLKNPSYLKPVFVKERWSNSKIDISFLNNFDADIDFLIQKFALNSLVFNDVKAKLHLLDGILNLDAMSGALFGGMLVGSGKFSSQISQPLNFNLSIDNAQLKNIIPTQGRVKITEGILNFKANIHSRGNSVKEYVENVSGEVTLDSHNGVLSGLNLQNIINILNNAKNLRDALKVLDNSFLQGKTTFDSINASMTIKDGIAKVEKCKMISSSGTINANGMLDIPKYWLDLEAIIAINIKNVPAFNTNFYGPFDHINYKIDTKVIQKYLVDHVLTGVIEDIKNGKVSPKEIIQKIFSN